jgi:hypothetical protein
MKNTRILLSVVLVALLGIAAFPALSTAGTSTYQAWMPNATSGGVIFNLDLSRGVDLNNSLYIYDYNFTDAKMLVLGDGRHSNASVYFRKIGDNWYAGLSEYFTSTTTGILDLGLTSDFGFSFQINDVNYLNYSYFQEDQGYVLDNENTGWSVFTTAQPVPIPASFLLLGAGIVGLVTIRRRNAA